MPLSVDPSRLASFILGPRHGFEAYPVLPVPLVLPGYQPVNSQRSMDWRRRRAFAKRSFKKEAGGMVLSQTYPRTKNAGQLADAAGNLPPKTRTGLA
mmetsp:Transcript_25722/g.101434  ORF Transcript_25722/g.101434 Transcript_25722/m.101434 type:complete len:97 (-) Transcript_25722:1727-2017(-)